MISTVLYWYDVLESPDQVASVISQGSRSIFRTSCITFAYWNTMSPWTEFLHGGNLVGLGMSPGPLEFSKTFQ